MELLGQARSGTSIRPTPAFAPRESPQRTAEILHPLSAEQRLWLGRLEGLLAPQDGRGGWLARAVAWSTVVPLTLLTPFSLTYQAYLNLIFHRTRIAWLGHALFIPITTWWIMVAACPLVGAAPATHAIGWATLFAWNGAAVVAGVLAVWYLTWAVLERAWLWGATCVAVVAVMWLGANAYYVRTHLGGDAAWYAATETVYNPLLWMAVSALCQALSHIAEPDVPPRMNGTSRWIPMRAYVRGDAGYPSRELPRAARFGTMAAHFVCGPIDEWMAAARLLPVYILELLFFLGYQPARRAHLRSLAAQSLSGSDPALDYVGTGGGMFLRRTR